MADMAVPTLGAESGRKQMHQTLLLDYLVSALL